MSPAAVELLASVDLLLERATARSVVAGSDGKSGNLIERITVDGTSLVVKHLCVDESWLMRVSGDPGRRQLDLFTGGLLDRLPASVDHAVVACAPEVRRGRSSTALVMRDVEHELAAEGPISTSRHRGFLAGMAAMHAAYWDTPPVEWLVSLATHYVFLSPAAARWERHLARGVPHPVPDRIVAGWERLASAIPDVAPALLDLCDDCTPLVAALERTPATLVHGDCKLGNMGTRPDGAIVLLDGDRCGSGPATLDLAWYLAVNAGRLPEGAEATIAAYRAELERHGVRTGGWFPRQMALALLGAVLQLCWDKADGDPAELRWWADRAREGLALL